LAGIYQLLLQSARPKAWGLVEGIIQRLRHRMIGVYPNQIHQFERAQLKAMRFE
jgi:hypothetical protein